jgi:cytochrome c-type biogenesis protein CcmH/NrfG
MRIRFICLTAAIFLSVFAGVASGQNSNLATKGQFFLPDGDLPSEAIRFEIESDQGWHDIMFSDSNGRFLLDSLIIGATYTITVPSDEIHWGETKYKFSPDYMGVADARITLNRLPRKPAAKPDVISAPGAYAPDPKAAEMRDKGMKALQAGKLDEAETLLRQAIAADPKYSTAYYDLSSVLLRQRKIADAEAVLQKGLVADPKSVAMQLSLGIVLVREGKYADAVAPLRETLRLKPDQADAQVQLGAAFVELNQLDDAETQLLAAQKTKGTTDIGLEMYLGKLYYKKKDYPKSIDAFNVYLKLAPENSPNSVPIRGLIQNMQDELSKKNDH